MRFKVELAITSSQNEVVLPIRYHAIFLSLLKRGLSNTSTEIYQELYEQNHEKLFAQALVFQEAKFEKEEIKLLRPEVTWIWSSPKAELALSFYNAFVYLKEMKAISMGELTISVKNISSVYQTPLTEKSVVFQTLSPILIRNHDREQKKDWFLSYQDNDFVKILKENLTRRLIPELGSGVYYDVENLQIEPLEMKKTVTKTYEKFLEGSHGRIKFTGEPYLLNFIRDLGIGSKTGIFFGCVTVV